MGFRPATPVAKRAGARAIYVRGARVVEFVVSQRSRELERGSGTVSQVVMSGFCAHRRREWDIHVQLPNPCRCSVASNHKHRHPDHP